ncbi:hypothetical protein NECAME_05050 [Necator americanus]|uniref:TIL domain-containing protein n=1 Tax=Necator americanus TaxID=51031 RepID=W2SMP7_NECAM|nr:hypothetical protein NECAME_05050 [Necator americanus]ETN69992.1 hypothetical protein NECAME_05050 [Necator americanus]
MSSVFWILDNKRDKCGENEEWRKCGCLMQRACNEPDENGNRSEECPGPNEERKACGVPTICQKGCISGTLEEEQATYCKKNPCVPFECECKPGHTRALLQCVPEAECMNTVAAWVAQALAENGNAGGGTCPAKRLERFAVRTS